MSKSINPFSKPDKPDIKNVIQEEPEKVTTVEEDADEAARRKKKKLLTGGRASTVLSGIQTALKRRLGE
jgi:hypothetical protein